MGYHVGDMRRGVAAFAAVAAVVAASIVGCGDQGLAEGTERGKCFPNGTCFEGLACRSGLCVKPEPPQAQPATAPPTPTAAPREAREQDDVRAFLARWLNAQNDGNFDLYASLFATEFTGVRRSGPTKEHFDRTGWLKDRKRMFRKQMFVSADAVEIDVQPTYAQIVFTQEWASGTYKDTGKKQLVVIRDRDDWLIAREDMISSDYVPEWTKCDPEDDGCTGDDEFYANMDWDAYSDNMQGAEYVQSEIKRRYQGDINRCVRTSATGSKRGEIAATVVAKGRLRGVRVRGFEAGVNECIERVASRTWLFADPNESAWNDASPASIREGKVPFRVTIRAR